MVEVDLLTLAMEAHEYERQQSASARFITGYNSLGQFARSLKALIFGQTHEAVLVGRLNDDPAS